MSYQIPITKFAPAERFPVEIAHKQAAEIKDIPHVSSFFDSMINCVLILNEHRQIVYANKNFLNISRNNDMENLLGKRPGEALGCIHSDEMDGGCGTTEFCRECGAVKAVLESLEGRVSVNECRLSRMINFQPEALDFLVMSTPFTHNDRKYALFSLSDISHEKRRRALERIFFHDVINTAGGIGGLSEILLDSAPNGIRSDLALMHAGLEDLMDQILSQKDLSAAENNELHLTREKLNSMEILNSVIDLYRRHPVAIDREVRQSGDAEEFELECDRSVLKRVIGNLVKNALEAVKPGQTVTAACTDLGDKARFSVHNNTFMPRNVQLQVFNRSFSTKGLGRGLGTYSVKLLTEQYLKGEAAFTTSETDGTTFFVTIPKTQPDPDERDA